MGFPAYRPRRMRANPAVRAFVRETRVEPVSYTHLTLPTN